MTKILYTELNYDDTGGLQYCITGFSEHQASDKENTLYLMTIVRNLYSSQHIFLFQISQILSLIILPIELVQSL